MAVHFEIVETRAVFYPGERIACVPCDEGRPCANRLRGDVEHHGTVIRVVNGTYTEVKFDDRAYTQTIANPLIRHSVGHVHAQPRQDVIEPPTDWRLEAIRKRTTFPRSVIIAVLAALDDAMES